MMNPNPPDPVFHGFLAQQARAAAELSADSDLVEVIPMQSGICDRFIVELQCTGLTRQPDGTIQPHDRWAFGIYFPPTYLLRPVHVGSMLTFLGSKPLWHSNANGPFLCLNVMPGTSLVEIIHALADLVSWRLFSLADPLNEDAAQWARHVEPGRLPVDQRPLRWKAGQAASQTSRITVTDAA